MPETGSRPKGGSPFFILTVREIFWAGLLFVLLALLFLWPAVGAERVFMGPELGFFFIPLRQFWVQEVFNFTFPLWNPHSLSGTPLFATLQPAVLYPFSLFYLFLPFYLVFNLTLILHYALAGGFMYWLVRAQKASRSAALVSAFTFMFGGYLISVYQYPSTLLPVAWVPLLVLCYFAGLVKRDLRFAVLAGIVGTVMFLGGGLEVCYMFFPFLVLFSIFPGMMFGKDISQPLGDRLVYVVVFSVVYFSLSAIQLLPTLELAGLSTRSGGGMSTKEALAYSLQWKDVLRFVLPDPFAYGTEGRMQFQDPVWLMTFYTGIIPFILSGLYFFRGGRRAGLCLVLIGISLVLAMGRDGLLFPLFREFVPLFDTLRFPMKFLLPVVFILAVTSGWGLDIFNRAIESEPGKGRVWAKRFLVVGFLAILVFAVFQIYHSEWVDFLQTREFVPPDFTDPSINLFNLKRLLVFLSLFCLALFLYGNRKGRNPWYLAGAVLILGIDLFFAHWKVPVTIPVSQYEKTTGTMEFVQSDPSLFRIYATLETRGYYFSSKLRFKEGGNLEEQLRFLRSQIGTPRGISDVLGRVVMRPKRYEEFITLVEAADPETRGKLLDLLNVKYFISVPKIDRDNVRLAYVDGFGDAGRLDPARQVELENQPTIKLYENLDVLPRAFLVGSCRVASDENFRQKLSDPAFDPARTVLLEESPEDLPCETNIMHPADIGESVTINGYRSTSVDLEVKSLSRKFLVLSDTLYPGWVATVDDRPVTVYRANHAFRAIIVEPGDHHVRFEYKPLSFRAGMAISFLSLIACSLFLAKGGRFSQFDNLSARLLASFQRNEKQSPSLAITFLFIFCIVFAVFSGALGNDFVNWDDRKMVVENPFIKSLSLASLWSMVTEFHMGNWMPLTWLSYALNYQFSPTNPAGYHFGNILVHGFNAVLVFLLFRRIIELAGPSRWDRRSIWTAGVFVSLLFALSPLRVESVVWISERKDVLCTFFVLLTYLSYLSYGDSEKRDHRKWWYGVTLGSFSLALLSKPMAVTVPLTLILMDVFPLNRLNRQTWGTLLKEKILFFILSAGAALLAVKAVLTEGLIVNLLEVPFLYRFLNAVKVACFYLKQSLLPTGLVPLYPFSKSWDSIGLDVVGSILLFAGITWFCLLRWKARQRFWMVSWVYFLLALLPVMGLFQVGSQAAADRYTYLSGVVVYFLAGAGLLVMYHHLKRNLRESTLKRILQGCGFSVLLLLGSLTVQQIRIWENSMTLWKRVDRVYPDRVFLVHVNLGNYYADRGWNGRAEIEYRRALSINPRFSVARTNLGLLYLNRNQLDKAEKVFKEVIEGFPGDSNARNGLGLIYFSRGLFSRAEEEYKTALEFHPRNKQVLHNLGLLYFQMGRYVEAQSMYRSAIDIDPLFLKARYKLGLVYLQLGLKDKGENELRQVFQMYRGSPIDEETLNTIVERF